jgi:hypothetical protein
VRAGHRLLSEIEAMLDVRSPREGEPTWCRSPAGATIHPQFWESDAAKARRSAT